MMTGTRHTGDQVGIGGEMRDGKQGNKSRETKEEQ